eukprot:scaffold31351_cov34-Prasinocladus_malaysianus.AAC.1
MSYGERHGRCEIKYTAANKTARDLNPVDAHLGLPKVVTIQPIVLKPDSAPPHRSVMHDADDCKNSIDACGFMPASIAAELYYVYIMW